MRTDPGVVITCPTCDRPMAKVLDIAHLICQRCGSELFFRSREAQASTEVLATMPAVRA